MRYFDEIDKIKQEKPTVISLGKFDGLHRGHQKLLSEMKTLADENGYEMVLFTFKVSPQITIANKKNQVIVTNEEKRILMENAGIDVMVECRFTDELRNMEAEAFIENILQKKLNAKAVVVGSDFCFGKNRRGNALFLEESASKYDLIVRILEKETDGEREISSTYIKSELVQGNIEKVNELLGASYYISGKVVGDSHIGSSIGFPTINIIPAEEKLLPPFGVYSSFTSVDGVEYASITNIGIKPTVGGKCVGTETHILDFNGNLYGKNAVVMLEHFQRKEEKFDSVTELKEQLEKDIEIRRSRL